MLTPLVVLAPAPGSSDLRAAAFPGDNGRVAFVSDRAGNDEIYAMLPDGSTQTRLTTSAADEGAPAWSPDGTRLLFTRSTPVPPTTSGGPVDESDLYVMAADGSGVRQLTDTAARERAAAWSPDGTRIAYMSDAGQDTGTYDLWVMDADGSDQEVLVDVPGSWTARSPAWSPDGSSIAYAANDGPGTLATRIVVAGADGSGPSEVAVESDGADEPEWSPDGSRIVYVDAGRLTVMGRDGSTPAPVVPVGTGPESGPSWSPDGETIVYARLTADFDFRDVWRVAPDGSGNVQLTPTDTAFDAEPSWQPAPRAAALSITPDNAAREVTDEATVVVTARDVAGEPVVSGRLFLRITGAHPRTALRTTDGDGRAEFTWEGTAAGTDTVLVCADEDASSSCGPGEVATSATVLWSPRAPVDRPRLAFTDDSDALYTMSVTRTTAAGVESYTRSGAPTSYPATPGRWAPGPTHEGEAGGVPTVSPVFVSTRDDPRGEVYRAPGTGGGSGGGSGETVRVTCDPGAETHPVLSVTGAVAYASDADGDWDVYVSTPPPPPGPGRAAPPARATACDAGWTTVNVTDELDGTPTYDDLWPSWLYGSTGPGSTSLVFSRAATGDLPDLFQVVGVGPAYGPPTAITTTPDVAETQPAAMTRSVTVPPPPGCEPCFSTTATQGWIAFTTTAVRSSGTVAILSPSDPTTLISPTPERLRASEPAWSSTVNPTHLAVTSPEEDPYGDLAIAQVDDPTLVAGPLPSDPVVSGLATVGGDYSGIAQSHAHWLQGFDGDAPATLVYTGRADDGVAPTARRLHADVSDVLAVDGSQRRTIRRQRDLKDGTVVFRYDEAGPAYSPTGTRILWTQDVAVGSGVPQARVLMSATDDGDDPAPLLPAGARRPLDVDLDPVWSPDGSRVAFVRIRRDEKGTPGAPEIWVHDLGAATVTRIPGTAVAGNGADLSPSWAPDSTHLVIARSEPGGTPRDAARRWSRFPVPGSARLVLLDVTRPALPAVEMDYCFDGCDVRGRSPAWSPDGRTIVYDDDGDLRTVALPADCCAGPVVDVGIPVAVTGFDDSTFDVVPTPSRSVIATAQDPAWSPDGREIAFSGQPVGLPDARGIWGIAPDGTGLRLITDEPGPETEPAWQDQRETDLAITVSVAPAVVNVGTFTTATFTARNDGPSPAYDVSLGTAFTPGAVIDAPGQPATCRADGTGCEFPTLDPGESRVYQVRVRHASSLTGLATGTVIAAGPPDPDVSDNTASALYRFLAADVKVRIKLDEPVGYVGGERTAVVTVRNVGSDPLDDVDVNVIWPAEVAPSVPPPLPLPAPPPAPPCLPAGAVCLLGTLLPGAKRSVRIGLEMLAETAAPVTLGAEVATTTSQVDTTNDTDEVELVILQPAIRVLPSVAPPGKVVLAYGDSMPPGSEIDLAWTPGITIHRGPFLVRDDGTVRVPLLVVRHDLLGTRLLTATSTEDLFTPVDGDLLVVPRTLGPPNFNGRS